MRINPKSQKGAITLVVLVAMLFLTAFLMSMYIGIANKAKTSAENTKQIAEQYNNIEEANTIYDSYFADTEVIPICTKEQLEKVGSEEQVTVNGKVYTFSPSAYYTIQNDLDLGGYYDEATSTWKADEPWTPLTSTFTGVIDGLGNTITGLYINNAEATNQGLFGTLKGTVKNLNILGSYVSANEYVGAIAGLNEGKIENCHNKATVIGTNYVGGIAGNLTENIVNCYNTGNIIADTNVTGGYFKSITTGETIEVWSDSVLEENAYFVSGEYTATAPKGFKVSKNVFEQTIEDGMVVQDNEENEFVWVPCSTEGSTLNTYTQNLKYNDGTSASLQWNYLYDSSNPSTIYYWDDNGAAEYEIPIDTRKTSVDTYKGFYIGRYEAGWPEVLRNGSEYTASTVKNVNNKIPVSKKGVAAWGYINQENALCVSSNMYGSTSSVTSSLIDSYAWDTVVTWIEKDSNYSVMLIDSTEYGNYYNHIESDYINASLYAEHLIIDSGRDIAANYYSGNVKLPNGTDSKVLELATGTLEAAKVNNIYDMAGNMYEWTTEKSERDSATYAVRRGGSFNLNGEADPISMRVGAYKTNVLDFDFGFRVVLYIK